MKITGWQNLDAAFAELEAELTAVTKGLIVDTWNKILVKTPQDYGGYAASWTLTYTATHYVDRSRLVSQHRKARARRRDLKFESLSHVPKGRGDRAAISIANAASAGAAEKFKLGDVVYFTNGVNHGEGPYSAIVEAYAPVQLRWMNRPGRAVGRTLDQVQVKYAAGISRAAALRLKAVRMSDAASDS